MLILHCCKEYQGSPLLLQTVKVSLEYLSRIAVVGYRCALCLTRRWQADFSLGVLSASQSALGICQTSKCLPVSWVRNDVLL